MNSQTVHGPRPLLDPVVLAEWLPKLGEKALLAWIQFQGWVTEMNESEGELTSHLIPTSLNKIIQKLQTGKSTFYGKILHPLLSFGLVYLQRAPHSKQELRLIVHNAPVQPQPYVIVAATPNLDEQTPTVTLEKGESKQTVEKPAEPLPATMEAIIDQDDQLSDKKETIVQAFNDCKDHPLFNEPQFLEKIYACLQYRHVKNFGAYLLKSLHNEWNSASSNRKKSMQAQPQRSSQTLGAREASLPRGPITGIGPTRPSSRSSQRRGSDLPEWVIKQQQRQELGLATDKEDKLSPEQQAIAADLLRKLEALGS
ncbi:hypothetical protein BEP19_09300 [Ammoniphilus oxalaticus]|uniref:Uncharacterized protein n=1 Tax=Ammoniphilus oxalaticus TaxID=66863 RepID=A0A419SKQ4_9BACL|nr:hypothetical protein [Ammoniphilus oxalaticus]RKD24565.1 hypothetical protein BEP19_09300 [Ammoniphilus oxalaticus]